MTPKELTWDQTLRFRLLEIVLQWEGRLTTNHLMTAFNIGRQQASRDINHYLTHYSPEGLIYDRSLKGYKPTEQFMPRFSEGKVDEYLMLLHREKQHQRQHEAGLLTLPLMDLRYGHIEILDVTQPPYRPQDCAGSGASGSRSVAGRRRLRIPQLRGAERPQYCAPYPGL